MGVKNQLSICLSHTRRHPGMIFAVDRWALQINYLCLPRTRRHPGMIFAVDRWALKINYLSVYPVLGVSNTKLLVPCFRNAITGSGPSFLSDLLHLYTPAFQLGYVSIRPRFNKSQVRRYVTGSMRSRFEGK